MCIYAFLSPFVLRFEPMLIVFISFALATFATTQKNNKKYPSLTSGEGDLLRWLDWWKYPLKKIKRRRVDLKFRKTLERYIQSSQMKIYWFLITKKKDSWQHWYDLIVLVPSSFHIVFFFWSVSFHVVEAFIVKIQCSVTMLFITHLFALVKYLSHTYFSYKCWQGVTCFSPFELVVAFLFDLSQLTRVLNL